MEFQRLIVRMTNVLKKDTYTQVSEPKEDINKGPKEVNSNPNR
jgi:hypothetical protein